MTNITINAKRNEIIITKAFEKKASKYNSEEYKELKAAKADFPTFKVVAKASSSKKTFKGLTFDFMKKYIEAHDDENHSKMDKFNEKVNSKMLYGETTPYAEITTWFLDEFPAVKEFRNRNSEAVAA